VSMAGRRHSGPNPKKPPVVIIGGSGFQERLQAMDAKRRTVRTPFGNVPIFLSKCGDREVIAIQRHGVGHKIPPHNVNYRGHIFLAKKIGAEAILASAAVGVISPEKYPLKSLVLCKDVVPWHLTFDGGPVTFFNEFPDAPRHADCSELFSEGLNKVLLTAAANLSLKLRKGAVLVTTRGPRYETPAEIGTFKKLGYHLVGMTTAYEAILAAEQGTPYAVVAIATNLAAGISGKRLSHDEVDEVMQEKADDLYGLFMQAIKILKIKGS